MPWGQEGNQNEAQGTKYEEQGNSIRKERSPKYALFIVPAHQGRQGCSDGLPVLFRERAARFPAALPARQVVGGVDRIAPGTGVAPADLLEPRIEPHRPDPLPIREQLSAVRGNQESGARRGEAISNFIFQISKKIVLALFPLCVGRSTLDAL